MDDGVGNGDDDIGDIKTTQNNILDICMQIMFDSRMTVQPRDVINICPWLTKI